MEDHRIFWFACVLSFFSGATFASAVGRDAGAPVDPVIWVLIFLAFTFIYTYWPKKKRAHKG